MSAAIPLADPPVAAGAPAPPLETNGRLTSIDIIRGAVMILMALDHVRVFSGVRGRLEARTVVDIRP